MKLPLRAPRPALFVTGSCDWSWCGGEFLDTEWYYDPPPPSPPPPPLPEPWRWHRLALTSRCFLFRRSFIAEIARPDRLLQIRNDVERISTIRQQILEHGLERPLEITIDANGRIVLHNGHHRLLATAGLDDFDLLPACFDYSDGIRTRGRRVMDVLESALASATPV